MSSPAPLTALEIAETGRLPVADRVRLPPAPLPAAAAPLTDGVRLPPAPPPAAEVRTWEYGERNGMAALPVGEMGAPPRLLWAELGRRLAEAGREEDRACGGQGGHADKIIVMSGE